MFIQLEIPDNLPEGRRASFKKGIADALIKSATTNTVMEYTPEGHKIYREQGQKVGSALGEIIQSSYPK